MTGFHSCRAISNWCIRTFQVNKMESLSCVCVCALTVEEAVVFEAASAEQRVERVQALLALHGASVRSVDVRGAFWGQRAGQLLLRQLLVPETHTQKIKAAYSHELKERTSSSCQTSVRSVSCESFQISLAKIKRLGVLIIFIY